MPPLHHNSYTIPPAPNSKCGTISQKGSFFGELPRSILAHRPRLYFAASLAMLHVGFSKQIELLKGGCLFIDDEGREIPLCPLASG
jgi:hypothetical protein